MDNFFDNILIYVPIIFIILFRILGMRNRPKRPQAAPREETAEPVEPPRKKPPERQPRKEPPRTNKIPSPGVLFPESSLGPAAPAKPPAAAGRPAGGFPGNLNYLPALKRAMVLTEIMGPPKALQGERDKRGFEPPWST
ncbi:MAG: hypothetical protein LBB78_09160 [Spirochaetaceae bacterium]|jgi:hypothetical protein|nr:hypothetical protein [Spirochaetaceae bacterium]